MKDIGNKYYQYADSRTAKNSRDSYKRVGELFESNGFKGTPESFKEITQKLGNSANTDNHRLTVLKGFLTGMITNHDDEGLPTELFSCVARKDLAIKTTPQLSVSEYDATISYCEEYLSPYTKQLGIMLRTGVRYNELDQVIEFINSRPTGSSATMSELYESKTHRVRTLYIPEMSMHMKNIELVESINQRKFNKWLLKNFDFDSRFTAHGTRGSFASYMHYHGMPTELIAMAMGKTDKRGIPQSSFWLYLKVNNTRVHDAIQSIFDSSSRGQESIFDLKLENRTLKEKIVSLRRLLRGKTNPKFILSKQAEEIHRKVLKDD